MTVGSIYSGIGGLDLGFERAGFEIAWQVEINQFCRAALKTHWPHVPCYEDVRQIQWRVMPWVDVIVAGFPCQDVSDAGRREGIGGGRSWLWWHVRRAARLLRPSYLVVENVPGLYVRGIDTVLGSLARIGFDAEWAPVRASDVGAPHRRKRVFIVAYPHRDPERHEQQRIERWQARYGEIARQAGARRLADTGRSERRTHSEAATSWLEAPIIAGDPRANLDVAERGRAEPDGSRAELADAADDRRRQRSAAHHHDGRDASRHDVDGRGSGALADASRAGLPLPEHEDVRRTRRGHEGRAVEQLHRWPARPGQPQHDWEPPRVIPSRRAQSKVGVRPTGVSRGLVGRGRVPAASAHPTEERWNPTPGWRRAALEALGNAVVPQVAEVVAWRVRELMEQR